MQHKQLGDNSPESEQRCYQQQLQFMAILYTYRLWCRDEMIAHRDEGQVSLIAGVPMNNQQREALEGHL